MMKITLIGYLKCHYIRKNRKVFHRITKSIIEYYIYLHNIKNWLIETEIKRQEWN